MKKILILLLTLAASLNVGSQESLRFVFQLSGRNEVPPNGSPNTGSGWFTLDENVLNYAVGIGWSFEPTGAGVYGPATATTNGQLIFDWPSYLIEAPYPEAGIIGGISYLGGYYLNPEQIGQLRAGLWYVNIKSSTFPDGEIRGQILPLDSDGDGVPDFLDLCSDTPTNSVVSVHGCSIDQLAPCDAPWRSHGAYVSAVERVASMFFREGLISRAEMRALVQRAAQSDCGKDYKRGH